MGAETSITRYRTDFLRRKIEAMNEGETILYESLIVDLRDELRNELKDDKEISSSKIAYSLRRIKDVYEQENYGFLLIVGRKSVTLTTNEETIFDQNMRSNVDRKKAIGVALWKWLLSIDFKDGINFQEYWNRKGKEIPHLVSKLSRKKSIARSRISLGMVVDAGSTNTIIIQELLDNIKQVPLVVRPEKGKQEEDIGSVGRLISPVIITNSIVIADKIGRSKFRHEITLRLIGGTDRPERKSICGELSLLWLRACHSEGKMVSLDLAIVGCTGISNAREVPMLGCDVAEEGSLKSRLLSMASCRIITMDSSKIIHGASNSIFSSISGGDVDLIVTDEGVTKKEKEAVASLGDTCNKSGVGLLVAKYEKK